MREKANQIRYEEEQYRFGKPDDSSTSKKRLDLNDLLKRAKEVKKYDKKINYSIFFGMFSIVVAILLILNLE